MSYTYLKFALDRANTVRTPEAYGLAYFYRRGDGVGCDVLRLFSTIRAQTTAFQAWVRKQFLFRINQKQTLPL